MPFFSASSLKKESERLYKKLSLLGWSKVDCRIYAPLTLEINQLKKEKDAIILAHSYQTPDIMYGVADHLGDSYNLSIIASKTNAKIIIFCSVYFMGETAKLLNPQKQVIVPSVAGCSLADSITPQDVRTLRKKHPQAGVLCYVNTSAEVKAESDVCCTSANALKVLNAMPESEIIFLPDKFMGQNLQKLTAKKIITYPGKCIVHENFTEESVKEIRQTYPNVKILAHIECAPNVIALSDLAGSTNDMLEFIRNSTSDTFMLITECGITDRVKTEFPDKKIVGLCTLCPYMKKIQLKDVLTALKNPSKDQLISIPEKIAVNARRSLEKMLELTIS